jgi:hypothetical protein
MAPIGRARWCSTAPSSTRRAGCAPAPRPSPVASPRSAGRGRARRGEASVLILSDRRHALHVDGERASADERRGRRDALAAADGPGDLGPPQRPASPRGSAATRGSWWRRARCRRGTTPRCSSPTARRPIFPYLFYAVGAPHGPVSNLTTALEETLKRIMSKMGICSVDGYRGSRLFEAVGLAPTWSTTTFPASPRRLGGLELEDIYDDLRARREAGGGRRAIRIWPCTARRCGTSSRPPRAATIPSPMAASSR